MNIKKILKEALYAVLTLAAIIGLVVVIYASGYGAVLALILRPLIIIVLVGLVGLLIYHYVIR